MHPHRHAQAHTYTHTRAQCKQVNVHWASHRHIHTAALTYVDHAACVRTLILERGVYVIECAYTPRLRTSMYVQYTPMYVRTLSMMPFGA